ncbi:hypothetical protein GCM10011416_03130 [Polaribacter pacificus]|uniref:Outer membrane protein beta-barrel domain-containing protein n=1 Tax=Polaribacter pacificus TaxID=1775173 RepID=A0A917HTY8_9FLAO|nr:hypothetical protein [Polaribacter pacificus]GGG89947.1 hypothetical protein GCM10011416_03130 [Polaribacter pacificus]
MKKTFLIIGLLFAATFTTNAQEIAENAIGLRLGGNNGFGGEISYQRKMSENNRLEIDLGIRNGNSSDSFKATGIYQWVWTLEDKFNWYAGAGGGIGSIKNAGISETFIFATGDIGIEYNFDAPILISLDYRPEFGFSDAYDGLNSDLALSVRYQF